MTEAEEKELNEILTKASRDLMRRWADELLEKMCREAQPDEPIIVDKQ